jgi:hypothetical protein
VQQRQRAQHTVVRNVGDIAPQCNASKRSAYPQVHVQAEGLSGLAIALTCGLHQPQMVLTLLLSQLPALAHLPSPPPAPAAASSARRSGTDTPPAAAHSASLLLLLLLLLGRGRILLAACCCCSCPFGCFRLGGTPLLVAWRSFLILGVSCWRFRLLLLLLLFRPVLLPAALVTTTIFSSFGLPFAIIGSSSCCRRLARGILWRRTGGHVVRIIRGVVVVVLIIKVFFVISLRRDPALRTPRPVNAPRRRRRRRCRGARRQGQFVSHTLSIRKHLIIHTIVIVIDDTLMPPLLLPAAAAPAVHLVALLLLLVNNVIVIIDSKVVVIIRIVSPPTATAAVLHVALLSDDILGHNCIDPARRAVVVVHLLDKIIVDAVIIHHLDFVTNLL